MKLSVENTKLIDTFLQHIAKSYGLPEMTIWPHKLLRQIEKFPHEAEKLTVGNSSISLVVSGESTNSQNWIFTVPGLGRGDEGVWKCAIMGEAHSIFISEDDLRTYENLRKKADKSEKLLEEVVLEKDSLVNEIADMCDFELCDCGRMGDEWPENLTDFFCNGKCRE